MLNKRLLLIFTTANAIVCIMWKEIILDLMTTGLNQHEIAALVGVSQAHISDLSRGKRGKRIGFEIGNRLHELHRDRCPKHAGMSN